MAKRLVLDSDISGKPDATTVLFGLEGDWYEIDLTDEERQKLERALKKYLVKGRKATAETTRLVGETTPDERHEIRAWAEKEGYEIAPRGRIPQDVLAAYDEAHGIERTYVAEGHNATTKAATNRDVPAMTADEREKIRAWARRKGMDVAGKGQIPKMIVAAYDKAHRITRGE
ncbi:Lsr2 family protein [Saccharothrix sp. AJ9571]|nr:Lsr2 family protein [Saccharothrix sp. AJ9571]